MAKVLFADRYRGNSMEKALIGDDKMLVFSMLSGFKGEFPIDYNLPYVREVDIVSILYSNGEIEIAHLIDGVLTIHPIDIDIREATQAMRKFTSADMPFSSTRRGSVEGIPYTQYIYVFDKGKLTENRLLGVLSNG